MIEAVDLFCGSGGRNVRLASVWCEVIGQSIQKHVKAMV